ncbi:MAG TPA: 1,4-alpha-glucan branching protein domain-containing protein, partial [Jatrophihabitans sp.]|nr:1,4-alpha-glucan branching protein domain-containing protein [Jatrophihabitans sp.]
MIRRQPVGTFCLVLHTHLPWVAHNGTWPVGEEWLHQAFTGSWRRVLAVLEGLAEHGYRDVLTLGVTPVLAAMLDDPYCLSEIHGWTGRWQLRAEELVGRPDLAELARWEFREAARCLADLEARWRTGGLSSVLRPLREAGVLEVLSGPATHPFLPLLSERFAEAQLRTGLTDTALRLGRPVTGIWAPECGYAPGMAELYARSGVSHFLLDGPAVHGDTGLAHPVAGTGVLAFARDLPLSERIWSSRTGYPGAPSYRDFHSVDHGSGLRPHRVTGSAGKRVWQPAAAQAAVLRDARDFVSAVVARLGDVAERLGRPGLAVAAFDTELFGHWWYEGPQFLDAVLRQLPQAGVRLTTLAGACELGLVGDPIEPPASSWGAGKDWRIWNNEGVAVLNDELAEIQKRLFVLRDDPRTAGPARRPELDQLAREAMLASASDWAFMISRDTAAEYGWQRARDHAARFHALADAIEDGAPAAPARRLADRLCRQDGPFGHL